MDTTVPGFGVRVSRKGKLTFILFKRYPSSKHPSRREIGRAGPPDGPRLDGTNRQWDRSKVPSGGACNLLRVCLRRPNEPCLRSACRSDTNRSRLSSEPSSARWEALQRATTSPSVGECRRSVSAKLVSIWRCIQYWRGPSFPSPRCFAGIHGRNDNFSHRTAPNLPVNFRPRPRHSNSFYLTTFVRCYRRRPQRQADTVRSSANCHADAGGRVLRV